MDTRVKYATMIVNGMEESVAFYRDVMGFKIDSTYAPAPGSRITLMKGKGETLIELIEDKRYDVGYYSVGMNVDDMDAAVRELKSKASNFSWSPPRLRWGASLWPWIRMESG